MIAVRAQCLRRTLRIHILSLHWSCRYFPTPIRMSINLPMATVAIMYRILKGPGSVGRTSMFTYSRGPWAYPRWLVNWAPRSSLPLVLVQIGWHWSVLGRRQHAGSLQNLGPASLLPCHSRDLSITPISVQSRARVRPVLRILRLSIARWRATDLWIVPVPWKVSP